MSINYPILISAAFGAWTVLLLVCAERDRRAGDAEPPSELAAPPPRVGGAKGSSTPKSSH